MRSLLHTAAVVLALPQILALIVQVNFTIDEAWLFVRGIIALTASGWLVATRGAQ